MSNEEIIKKTYFSPIVGSGREGDERKPLLVSMFHRRNWMMHELKDGKNCLVTVYAPMEEHVKLAGQTDFWELPAAGVTPNLPVDAKLKAEITSKLPSIMRCGIGANRSERRTYATQR